MDPYFEMAKAQAIHDISEALCRAVGDVMAFHGDDPYATVIIAAGFANALEDIGKKIDQEIPKIVSKLLA